MRMSAEYEEDDEIGPAGNLMLPELHTSSLVFWRRCSHPQMTFEKKYTTETALKFEVDFDTLGDISMNSLGDLLIAKTRPLSSPSPSSLI